MTDGHASRQPLQGVRVIEFCQIAAGPFAGSLLADLGADVVKVERPDGGDGLRTWPPFASGPDGPDHSENFAAINRNKRSIMVDVKKEGELEGLKRLCSRADVFIENYRPGTVARLGLDYDALHRINKRLVYCSVSGYGQTGPYAQRGAYDVTVQAASGVMSVTGENGRPPVKCGVPIGDFCAGLYAAYCIVTCLLDGRRTGDGNYIDCSMLGSLLGISALQTSEYFGTGTAPRALGSAHPRNAPYEAFEARDRPFVLAAGNDRFWREVCDAVGLPELTDDPRFCSIALRARNQDELRDILAPVFGRLPADHWLSEFNRRGVPCAPLNTYPDALADPHVRQMGIVHPLPFANGHVSQTVAFPAKVGGCTFEIRRPSPELGQHSEEVFREWLSDE